MNKDKIKPKRKKIFTKRNFIETEAEEVHNAQEDDSEKESDLFSFQINTNKNNFNKNIKKEEDNYGDIVTNDTTNFDESYNEHRLLFNTIHFTKEIFPKRKRKKSKSKIKKFTKKILAKQVEKNLKSVERKLDIINTKLNLNIKSNINNPQDEEKSNNIKNDEDLIKLRYEEERRRISEFNKINNAEFIKRIKANEKFINSDNIITSDKKEKNTPKKKLKLFQLKGDILKNKK